jgi:hypothetical protein
MNLSWTNIKISIAGAKLSHLVQKDKIWDHGSMIEQVRTVVVHLKKALLRKDPLLVKKCVSSNGYKKIMENTVSGKWNMIIKAELISVGIISVAPSKHHQPDKFKALIKLRKVQEENLTEQVSFYKTNRQIEQEWFFVREGNWWLLDEIKK